MHTWNDTLERLDAQGLRRKLRSRRGPREGGAAGSSAPLDLASNDYLGLSSDPRVVEALHEGAERYGVGAGASRLITGTTPAHEELEADLAAMRGTEAALVFASGYATNLGVLQALAGRHDLIVADALCHASLLDGARLSGARLVRFRHNDPEHLARCLADAGQTSGSAFVLTEGVFSMEGDLADLRATAELAQRLGAILIVDDAHGTGITGPDGRGSVAEAGLGSDEVPVQIGTLSKALGTQGGYVAGSRTLIDLLVQRARSFVYSTGLSPAIAHAARTSIRLARDEPWRREQRAANAAAIRTALEQAAATVLGDPRAPMLLALLGDADTAVSASARLENAGVLAPAIRPPTVPAGTSRIRFAPSATTTAEAIAAACGAITGALRIEERA